MRALRSVCLRSGVFSLSLCALALLAGCGGGGASNTKAASFYLYTLQNTGLGTAAFSSSIQQYRPDTNGALTPTKNVLNLGANTASSTLLFSLDGSFGYAFVNDLSATTSDFRQLAVGSGGVLRLAGATHDITTEGVNNLALASDGRTAYAVISTPSSITTTSVVQGYRVGAAGTPTTVGSAVPFSGQVVAYSVAVSPGGSSVYILTQNGTTHTATVQQYTVDGDGNMTAIGTPFAAGSTTGVYPIGLVFRPNGQSAYLEESDNSVQQLAVDATGALTPVGSPLPGVAGNFPVGLAFSPDGAHAYAAASNGSTLTSAVQEYQVGTDGSLRAVGAPMTVTGGALIYGIGVLPVPAPI